MEGRGRTVNMIVIMVCEMPGESDRERWEGGERGTSFHTGSKLLSMTCVFFF